MVTKKRYQQSWKLLIDSFKYLNLREIIQRKKPSGLTVVCNGGIYFEWNHWHRIVLCLTLLQQNNAFVILRKEKNQVSNVVKLLPQAAFNPNHTFSGRWCRLPARPKLRQSWNDKDWVSSIFCLQSRTSFRKMVSNYRIQWSKFREWSFSLLFGITIN